MRTLNELERIIVGVDPGMATGKPVAAVSVGFWPGGESVVLDWATAVVKKDTLVGTLFLWAGEVLNLVEIQQASGNVPVYVVCERSRGVGGTGWRLQALLQHLKEVCEAEDIIFLPPISPTTLKKAVTGRGRASAKGVAQVIRSTVVNGGALPVSAGFDYEAATGAAVAGYAELKLKQLEELCKNTPQEADEK